MLGVVLQKAQEHYRDHPRWPILYLPEAIGQDAYLEQAEIERLALINLLFFCYADITDDAEDQDLSESWSAWGWPQAVNAGNCFLFGCLRHLGEAFPPSVSLPLLMLYTSAGLVMSQGQQLDLSNALPHRISLDEYLFSLQGKTGASLRAFASSPALVSKQSPSTVAGLAEFGENLGIVLQLVSDVREVWREPIGPDLLNGRLTLPLLYAFEVAPSEGALLEVLEEVRTTRRPKPLWDFLEPLGVRPYAGLRIEIYRRRALEALQRTGISASLYEQLEGLLQVPAFPSWSPMV